MPVLPRGTLSFLFTDIEGSTRLLQQLRESYSDVLGEHRRLLRDAFAPVGGLEFGTEGDAVFVVFRRARDAVQAAADAQRMLAAHPWPDGAQVRVRMGIHTGEPEMGPEGYTGLALHKAARICAAGHGGQVVLSNATRELVEDDLPPETTLRDLGEHRLKDLDRPERLFQLVVQGLQSEFAPVRSLEAPRRPWLSRPPVIAAVVAAVAAAIVIPVLASGGGSGGSMIEVAPNSVAVIDPRKHEVVGQIGVGARPLVMTKTPGVVWVGNIDDKSVTRIDVRSRQAVKTIALGGVPGDLASASQAVWAVTADPRQDFAVVRRIDPRFDTIARSIRVEGSQFGSGLGTVAADGKTVWASTGGYGQVSRIDAASNSVVATIDPTPAATSLATGGGSLWVGDASTGTVTRVHADTGVTVQTIPVGQGAYGLAFGAGALWVAASLDDVVVRIDARANTVTPIPVGRFPAGVTVGAGGVWVANSRDGTITRIDPATKKAAETITVGGSPQDIEVAGGLVWVSVQQAPRAEPVASGATLRVATPDQADSLDPALASGNLQWQVEYATCAKLLNYPDRPAPDGARLVPEVARSLPAVSPDGKTYTFTIRKGFRFSPPSGEPVTAATFAYAIERSLNPSMHRATASDIVRPALDDVVGAKAYVEGRAAHIAGVRARGNTLTIKLTKSSGDLPVRLAQPFFCAVPTDTPATPGGVRTVPSAGPYYVSAFGLGERIVLKRNPNYRGSRPHRLRQIEITQGATPRQLGAPATGEFDYSSPSTTLEAAAPLAARYGPASSAAKSGRQRYFVSPQLALDYLVLNTRRPLFADARTRRAVAYAVDRIALVRADISPSLPFDRLLPPGMPGSTVGQVYPNRPDLARAKQLVGTRGGPATFYTCNLVPCTQLAELVKQQLAPLGIDVRIEQFPVGRYLSVLGRRDAQFDIAFFGHTADSTDPGAFLEGLDLTTFFESPASERRLRAAHGVAGPARERTYSRLQLELTRDTPLVVFGVNVRQDFFSARMGCQVYNPLYGMDLAALCVKG